MLSKFYQRHGLRVLLIAALMLPFIYHQAETIPSNNDIEAWLPKNSDVRRDYEEFKSRFGAEEIILIGLDETLGSEMLESVCGRIERLPEIRHCWSPERMRAAMADLGVTESDIRQRLEGQFVSRDGTRVGIVAQLSDVGTKNRTRSVDGIREVLDYCQLRGSSVNVAGAPVVISELNRLGGRESNKKFFVISLGICLCLLYYQLRDWRLTSMILGLTVFAVELSVAILHWCGGEMNFVIDALPVMVMVFTLEVSVHLLSYFDHANEGEDRFTVMFQHALKPCVLATFTTAIGSWSLCSSDFVPVRQFGWAGTLGSFIAMTVGLFLTPAVIAVCPPRRRNQEAANSDLFNRASDWFLVRSRHVIVIGVAVTLLCGVGLCWLRSHIDPLEFFPQDSIVLHDVNRIGADLTDTDTLEAMVDFGRDLQLTQMPFVAKLEYVRQLEQKMASHPAVRHTMSLASLFPSKMPSGLELTHLLNRATKRQKDNDFLAGGEQYWRISANIRRTDHQSQQRTFEEMTKILSDAPVTLTGISPLIERAQHDIYYGFWASFVYAFWMIMLVMIVALRWVNAGFIGMLPNLAPIAVVFGFLGWIGHAVDISMMMSGSIAMGIAVDGSFHMLVRYQEIWKSTGDKALATRMALQETGPPIFQSTVIMSIGMLALTFSSFGPTASFGWLMGATLLVSLVGDSVLLPCMLGFFHTKRLAELRDASRKPRSASLQGPHFLRLLRKRYRSSSRRNRENDSLT